MRRITAAGATDVGRVREANEDAYLVADSVFAVADGMGGHLAGEVASVTSLEPIETLDSRVFADAGEAVKALREAVVAANATVSRMAEDEPSYRGMGTTLTAVMVEGRRLHVAHVGDSRAYLMRDQRFSQLTDDHTLVQHLVDEGQISREEAASHPQRSIVTRAIGVSPEVDVDSMTLDLEPGDQVLLCSDGLTGVLDDEVIAAQLRDRREVEETLQGLVDAALDGGGPDNVTVILLRYESSSPGAAGSAGGAGSGEGAGSVDGAGVGHPDGDGTDELRGTGHGPATVAISTRDDHPDGDWAGRLGSYGSPGGQGSSVATAERDGERPGKRRWLGRGLAVVLALALIAALVIGGGRFLLARNYFVGLDEGQVVIYQGLAASLGPIELARVAETTDLSIDDAPAYFEESLDEGIAAADLSDARRIVDNGPWLDSDDDQAPDAADEPDADGDGDGDDGGDDGDGDGGGGSS